MSLNQSYNISSSVALQTIDDESLLMDEKTQLFFELNSSGTIFWEILQKHNSLLNAFNEIMEYFEVSKEQLENDFNKFIDALKEHGMIEVNEKI